MNSSFKQIFATVTTGVVLGAGLIAGTQSSAVAAAGTGSWGSFAITDPTSGATAGTMTLDSPGFTSNSASWTTDSTGVSAPTGNSIWLNADSPSGAEYGTSRGHNYLQIGNARSGADSTTTFTFATPTPASGWSFTVGDIDADTLTITAKDKNNNTVAVSSWFQSAFNYCSGTPTPCGTATDLPIWDNTNTLTGNGVDTQGASAWFKPSASISSLTFSYHKLVGFPSFQLWFAGDNTPAQNYKVTFVARECPKFSDVMANKARNNIAEATSTVGVDSLYTGANAGPVRPPVENLAATGQGVCTPITNWKFATGTKIAGADTGSWGKLSKVGVSGADVLRTFTTQNSIPELDQFGTDTGRTIEGAVTFNMTAADIANAAARKYWVQGGAPGDPLSGHSTTMGFATLRCSIDNANADNVEFASFAATARHMFCYAYYVSNAPTSGDIKVLKYVPTGPNAKFGFGGNVSFNPGGKFTLNSTHAATGTVAAGDLAVFTRAVGTPWTITEDLPSDPYVFDQIVCYGYAHNGSVPLAQPTSRWTIDPATRKVVVTLGTGEDVGCTYTNKYVPAATLEVYKQTDGNTGTFPFTVGYTAQGASSASTVNRSVTTSAQLTPTSVYTNAAIDPTQNVTIAETLPTTFGGSWNPVGKPATIECVATTANGGALTAPTVVSSDTHALTSTVTPNPANGSKNACTVTNNFVPNAGITINSVVIGGSSAVNAASSYVINNGSGTLLDPADNLTPGIPERLTNTAWDASGTQSASETGLGFDTYSITGIAPENTSTETWALDSLVCTGGVSVSTIDSTVTFTLDGSSASAPEITCTYTYKITPMFDLSTVVVDPEVPATIVENATIVDTVDRSTTSFDGTPSDPQPGLDLPLLPEGTVVDIVEPTPETPSSVPAGEWNAATGGLPSVKCTGSDFTTTDTGIRLTITAETSCVVHTSFIEADAVQDTLPKTGGGNWFDRVVAAVTNLFD